VRTKDLLFGVKNLLTALLIGFERELFKMGYDCLGSTGYYIPPKMAAKTNDPAQRWRNEENPDEAAELMAEGSAVTVMVVLEPEVHASPSKLSKKERRLFKREVFQEYVAETLEKSVHSKSAQRRAKRRQKERLAADMSEMEQVLQTVIQDQPIVTSAAQQDDTEKGAATMPTAQKRPTDRDENGQIGESTRAKPLTKQQKKRALYVPRDLCCLPILIHVFMIGRWSKRGYL
ncbi:2140_t:CDS:2, partial [Acaulospora colombiana]